MKREHYLSRVTCRLLCGIGFFFCQVVLAGAQDAEPQDPWSRPQLSVQAAIEGWQHFPVDVRANAATAAVVPYSGLGSSPRIQLAFAHRIAKGWQAWGAVEYSAVGVGVGLKVDNPVGRNSYFVNQVGFEDLHTARFLVGLQTSLPLHKRSRILISGGMGIQWAGLTSIEREISMTLIDVSGPISVDIGEVRGNNLGLRGTELFRATIEHVFPLSDWAMVRWGWGFQSSPGKLMHVEEVVIRDANEVENRFELSLRGFATMFQAGMIFIL